MNQGVAGAWDGFSNAMGNNWNNVLGGFGWLMGRKEGNAQSFTNPGLVDPFSQTPMFSDSEKAKLKEIQNLKEELKILNRKNTLAANGSFSNFGGNPAELEFVKNRVKEIYNKLSEVTGLKFDSNGDVTPDRSYKDEFGNEIGTSKTLFGDVLVINGRVIGDGNIVRISDSGIMSTVAPEMVPVKSRVFVNGIMNKLTDAAESLSMVKQAEGKESYLVYNQSEGLFSDLGKSALGLLGFNAESSQDTLMKLIDKGQIGTLYSHSQGTIVAGNALNSFSNQRSSNKIADINWVGFGSPAGDLNMPEAVRSARFYYNSDDGVAMISNITRHKAWHYRNYRYIQWHQRGHGFIDGYNGALNDSINNRGI
jgi:hypothetical protein